MNQDVRPGKNRIRRLGRNALILMLLLLPARLFAGAEVTGVLGGLIGGDLTGIVHNDFSISRSFGNAPLYGVRVGYNIPFLQVEGSFVASPNGLSLHLPEVPVDVNTKVYYLEANVLLSLLPGFISPFVTAGIGYHHFDFDVVAQNIGSVQASFGKTGYNFGGGLKVHINQIVIRGEIRDHLTEIGPADFDLQDVADALGFDIKQKLHNVEVSVGVGIRF